jgi:8-oxo-dGTP pyrophosphatase MutT (NUDIX family)
VEALPGPESSGVDPGAFDLKTLRERLRDPSSVDRPAQAWAAVATILRQGPAGAEVLFIERAQRAGDPWSGQIAFPGGKREEEDRSLLETAVRETEEEVGIRLAPASCLAQLDVVAARTSGVLVAQYVFAPERDPGAEARTSAEVSEAFWIPLLDLARPDLAGTMKYVIGGREVELPCLHLGSHVLWGLTYRMVLQLLRPFGVSGGW